MVYSPDYDAVIVGGGLAGASLARGLAERGVRVLVLERETAFRDRVRGEGMASWGVAEARALGIVEPILRGCGQELRWFEYQDASTPMPPRRRDLVATTTHRAGFLAFAYPALQHVLLGLAESSGADVWRGAAVVGMEPGRRPVVRVRCGNKETTPRARLIVGADGRESRVRAWGGFAARRDRERLVIASTLFYGGGVPRDAVRKIGNPPFGRAVLVVPLGKDRFRAYLMYRKRGGREHLSGATRCGAFVRACVELGAPEAWFAGVERAGPLAEFEGAPVWVTHPYRAGVALVGDAAAVSDPSFGNGLSMTLRDARILRDQLLGDDDWDAAAHAYASEHDRSFAALRRLEAWFTDLMHEIGPEADARRTRALPRWADEPDRIPDIIGLGPDAPSDEVARRRFFAEDERES